MNCENIGIANGANNSPGLGTTIVMIPVADLVSVPEPTLIDPLGTGAVADLATITDNLVAKAGKKFAKFKCTNETAEIKSGLVGEADCKSVENTLEFFVPGTDATTLGSLARLKNERVIIAVKGLDGLVRIMGTATYPARATKPETMSGKARGDKRGTMFSFESVAPYPAAVFTGNFMEYNNASPSVSASVANIWTF